MRFVSVKFELFFLFFKNIDISDIYRFIDFCEKRIFKILKERSSGKPTSDQESPRQTKVRFVVSIKIPI